jgi:hypothetical protein
MELNAHMNDSDGTADNDNDNEESDDSEDLTDDDDDSLFNNCFKTIMGSIPAVAKTVLLLLQEIDSANENHGKIGGSLPGKSGKKNRSFDLVYTRLIEEYFSVYLSLYNKIDFCQQFRVDRDVFTQIYEEIINKGLFRYTKNCTDKYGIHLSVRTVSCFRFLVYGYCFDRSD